MSGNVHSRRRVQPTTVVASGRARFNKSGLAKRSSGPEKWVGDSCVPLERRPFFHYTNSKVPSLALVAGRCVPNKVLRLVSKGSGASNSSGR